jgi:hypothetical protein
MMTKITEASSFTCAYCPFLAKYFSRSFNDRIWFHLAFRLYLYSFLRLVSILSINSLLPYWLSKFLWWFSIDSSLSESFLVFPSMRSSMYWTYTLGAVWCINFSASFHLPALIGPLAFRFLLNAIFFSYV